MKLSFRKYAPSFSKPRFLKKVNKYFRDMGVKTTYSALLLYHAFERRDIPLYAKNIILGVLGYLISPIDWLPDFTPLFGYTDDLGVMAFGLVTIACYINDEVRIKARKQLKNWFGELDLEQLAEVDARL
ncbi:MAG: hypothetical protein CMN32_11770 [Saprospirales bacterium]|nr:hypothetical protein [Saprospirales bacterium]